MEASNGAAISQETLNSVIKSSTISAKAGQVALKGLAMGLNAIANIGITFLISATIKTIYDMVNATNELQNSVKEVGNSLTETLSSIDGYKEKISKLQETINDNASSYEAVAEAREELISVQDELIKKFGTEKDTIELITTAINGQTDALDNLSKKSYYELKNKMSDKNLGQSMLDFISSDNISNALYMLTDFDLTGAWEQLTKPTETQFSKMVNSMENAYYEFEKTGNSTLDELIAKTYDLTTTLSGGFSIRGNLDEVYNSLLEIQQLSKEYKVSDGFEQSLARIANRSFETYNSYKDFYNQYVLFEKILNSDESNNYDTMFNSLIEAKEKYDEALSSGDENKVKESFDKYYQILSDSMSTAFENGDEDVMHYFETMYPELQEMIGKWKFNVKFQASLENEEDSFNEDVQNAANVFGTSENIKHFNSATASQVEQEAYSVLSSVAHDMNLTIPQLIEEMLSKGIISSQAKEDLLDKLIPSRNKLTTGIESVMTDAYENVDANTVTNWVNSLSEEEIILAHSKEFNKSLEKQKVSLNGATFSAENYAKALKDTAKALEKGNVTKGFSKSEMIDSLNEMSDAFSVLDEIYADVKDGDVFDLSKITSDKFAEAFKGLEDEYSDFIETVASSPNELDKCKGAFDKLVTSYINQQEWMQKLDKSNKDVVISMLELYGVSNAETIVEEKLAEKNEENALAKKYLVDTSNDITEATNVEIAAYLLEQEVTDDCSESYARMALQKILVNSNQIDTIADVNQILKLAKAAGIGAEALAKLAQFKADLIDAENSGDKQKVRWIKQSIQAYSSLLQEEIDSVYNVDYTGGNDSNKSSSEKDKWLEKYKKEMSLLQDQLEQELITEREFYDKSEALLNQYLKDTPEHIQKYKEEISDAEKSLHSDWINAYQAEHDKLEQSLEDGKISAVEYCQQLAMLGQEYYGIFDSLTPEDVKEEYYALAKEAEKCGENVEEYIGKNGSKAVQKYGSYVKEAKEAVRELKEQIKNTFDNAINAVISVLDSQISELQDSCDNITKSYEEQQKAIEKQIKGYEKQIEAIEKQKDALEKQKDSLNEQLEAIEDATSERERQLSLEEALYNLNRLSNQKNKMVIDANGQKVYQTDNKAIASAREDVQKANEDIQKAEIEKQIKGIEKQIDLLDDQIDAINEIIDGLNEQKEEFEDLIEATEDYYDGIIKGLEDYQKQWQNLIDASEKQEALKTAQELGITEGEILGMSATAFANVKDKYKTLLDCIYLGNDDLVTQFATLNGLGTDEFVTAVGDAGTALSDFRDNSKAYLEETLKTTAELLGTGTSNSEEQHKGEGESKNEDTSNMVGVFDTSEMLISTGFDTFSETLKTKMQEVIDKAIAMANQITEACREAKAAMEELAGLTSGGSYTPWFTGTGAAFSKGTGASFADGTGRLSHAERKSIVGEIAPELVVDTERGTTQLFTKPTMVDLPKGAIVYNGDQTQRILENKQDLIGGKAHTSGTISNLGMTFEEFALKGTELRQMLSEQGYSPIFDKTKMSHNTVAPSVINNVTTNNTSTSINSNIGDIYVQGVQNPSGLAEQIVKNMPNLMIQKLNRRL